MTKKTVWLATLLGSALLAGCQNQANTVALSTPAPTAMFNTQNQAALVNVATQDLRPSAEVARYTSSGKVIQSVPAVPQLFQQAMQQNLNSKGFTIVSGAGNANVLVQVKKFFAQVEQGNLRYKINADIQLDVFVQGSRGSFSKQFNAARAYEGAFNADNENVQTVLNQAYSDVIQAIYNDNEIGNAIHQFK